MTGPCESSVKLDANYGGEKLARDCDTCLVLKEHLCPRLGVMTDRRRVYRLRVVLENMWEVQYVSPIITVASNVASTIWVKIGVVLRMIEITSQYLRNCKCGNQQTSESSRTPAIFGKSQYLSVCNSSLEGVAACGRIPQSLTLQPHVATHMQTVFLMEILYTRPAICNKEAMQG